MNFLLGWGWGGAGGGAWERGRRVSDCFDKLTKYPNLKKTFLRGGAEEGLVIILTKNPYLQSAKQKQIRIGGWGMGAGEA